MSITGIVGEAETSAAIAAWLAGFQVEVQRALEESGQATLDETQANTPVETGTLQSGWQLDTAPLSVALSNPVYYAVFVELGHHTRGGGSYVPGQYMLTNAVQNNAPRLESALKALVP